MSESEKHGPIRTDSIQGEIWHEYDGIEEADNQLPMWWLSLFYGAIVFGIGYWFAFHELADPALSPMQAYQEAVEHQKFLAAEEAKALAKRTAAGGGIEALVGDPGTVAAGKGLFVTNCVACHGASGEGNIGPNLTDAYWMHGGSGEEILEIIDKGFLAKGMPSWGPVLGPLGTKQVAAFVLSMRNTNLEGKEPQGELYASKAVK